MFSYHTITVTIAITTATLSDLALRVTYHPAKVAAIHDVKSFRLDGQSVEHVDLVHLAVSDVDKGRDSPRADQAACAV